MKTSAITILCLALAWLVIAGCGEDDVPETGDVSAEAEQLAERSNELQRDVRASVRRLIEEPAAREEQLNRLEGLEEDARRLANRAERRLPESDQAREALAEANRRTAEAARQARQFAESRDEQLLDDARAALDDARSQLDDAVGELPTDVRRELEDLQRELPEVPEQ
jgi:methyl-accepting chemotaxis protein